MITDEYIYIIGYLTLITGSLIIVAFLVVAVVYMLNKAQWVVFEHLGGYKIINDLYRYKNNNKDKKRCPYCDYILDDVDV